MTAAHEILRVGALALDLTTSEARYGDRLAVLGPIDARVLASFMRAGNRVVTHQELIDEHWRGVASMDNIYDRVVALRHALGAELIHTVPGVGYQLQVSLHEPRPSEVTLQSDDLQLDATTRRLHHGRAGAADLGPKDLRLVACLMHRVGRLATNEALARAGGSASVEAVADAMHRLRGKLRGIAADHLLVAVDGGYRFGARSRGLRRVAGLELDLRAGVARMHGRPLGLFPSAIALLELLTAEPGTTVARARLVGHAWGASASLELLDPAIWELRRALGETGSALIVAADGGYRLDVERFGLVRARSMLLDRDAGCLRFDDREEQLLPMQAALIEMLMRHADATLTRREIIDELGFDTNKALQSCMNKLRVKLRRLAPSPTGPELIVAGPGTYRLPLERLDDGLITWPLRFGSLRFSPATRELKCGERIGPVGPQPAQLLELLIRGDGLVDVQAVVEKIWTEPPTEIAVRSCQAILRQALDGVGAGLKVQQRRLSEIRLLHQRG